ncbi:MAG: DUF4339 domain-containing protein [Planctomycetes bacterium]|nr:DUF4339 domain-containing protein [Planctomycetota bacterium]
MNVLWFYRLLGEEFGPIPESQLEDLIQEGTLENDDLIRTEGNSDWQTVGSYKDEASTMSDHDFDAIAIVSSSEVPERKIVEQSQLLDDLFTNSESITKSASISQADLDSAVPFDFSASTNSIDQFILETSERPNRPESFRSPKEKRKQDSKPHLPVAKNDRLVPKELPTSKSDASPPRRVLSREPKPSVDLSLPKTKIPWTLAFLELLRNPSAIVSMTVILIVSLGIAWPHLPAVTRADTKRFRELKAIYDELDQIRSQPNPNFGSIEPRIQTVVTSISKDLEKTTGNRLRKELLWAARDDLPRMLSEMKQHPSKQSEAEQNFIQRLYASAQHLGVDELSDIESRIIRQ